MQILLVGCGNMGGAIVSGMLQSCNFSISEISAVLPPSSPDIKKTEERFGIKVYTSFPSEKKFDAILLAVKPQTLPEILPYYRAALTDLNTIVISIVAGKNTEYLASFFSDQTIVRTMPNINALVGKSTTVGYANKPLTSKQNALVEKIFSSFGDFHFVSDESLLDAVTALSGSGPAYFFQFIEHLTAAAQNLGLSRELAEQLAISTFAGSAHLLENLQQSPAALRQMVTSPGGTTAAALATFNHDDAWQKLTEAALKAAQLRAKELSK